VNIEGGAGWVKSYRWVSPFYVYKVKYWVGGGTATVIDRGMHNGSLEWISVYNDKLSKKRKNQ